MALKLYFGKKALTLDRHGIQLVDVDYSNHHVMYQATDVAAWLEGLVGKEYTDADFIKLFHSVAEIFAPIHAIAFRAAGATFQIKRVADDEVVFDNKALNKILSQPNPLQTFSELFYEAVVYEYVTGKNFLFANIPDTLAIDYKNVGALWNLWADRVQIKTDTRVKLFSATTLSDIIKGYTIAEAELPDFPVSKVLYSKHVNLSSGGLKLTGKSPLNSAKKAIDNIVEVYAARYAIYKKRGALGAMVSKKTDEGGSAPLLPSEKKQAQQDLNINNGFGKGQDLIAVTDQPVEFVRFGMSIQELEPFKETQADAVAIAGVFLVDKDLLPLAEGTTFENKRSAERGLYQNVIIPLVKQKCQALTNFLNLEKNGYYFDCDFSHVESLQANKKEEADTDKTNSDTYTAQYEKGLITLNAALIKMGHEAIDGGDIYVYDKKNNAPLAVTLGVGGTQALQSVLADTAMTEDVKKSVLEIMFGVAPEAAARMVTPAVTNNPQPAA